MKKSSFDKFINLEFEGHSLKGIQDYDTYLKQHYNNYMELPPKDKQKTHHTYKAMLR